MSVSTTTDNVCTGCFNWNSAPMIIASNVCNTAMTKITDCEVYNPGKTSNTAAAGDCIKCKSGKVVKSDSSHASPAVWTVTCVKSATANLKLDSVGCESGLTHYHDA